MKRVLVLCFSASTLALVVPTGASAAFKYGVTAGEVTPSSAILWTRADKTGSVTLNVARDKRFRKGLVSFGLKAKRGSDLTVQLKVKRLKPGKRYWFRFRQGKRRSTRGTFQTAPKSSSNAKIRFAWSGDTDASTLKGQKKPYWNNFDVFRRMQGEKNDFNIHFGDTIYSDSEVPGRASPVALTRKQKWAKYKLNLAQKKLQKLRATAGFYSHWDDHEFVNDFARGENKFGGGAGPDKYTVNANGQVIYKAGVKAFRDYAPVSYTSKDGLYRTRRWGRNLELFFLDERAFRSPKASANGTCDNPSTPGQPDLAPTAPQSSRSLFGLIVPSLNQPVSQACLNAINSPSRTYLGQRQLNKFLTAVKASKAHFKVIMNELGIQQYYVLPYDRWEGYEFERQKVLNFLKTNVKNVVFLTTDVHATLVNDARLKTLESGGPVNSGILDVTVGSAATETFEDEIDGALGAKGDGRLADDIFLEPQPPNGVGMQCSAVKAFSYGEVTVTSSKLTIAPKGIDGKPLQQDGIGKPGTEPCGPFVLNYKP